MNRHRQRYRINTMCRVLEVSRSGYYAWRSRPDSARNLADRRLLSRIRALFYASHETYGSPRIHAELAARGLAVGRKRVARLMRGAGLVAKAKRRFKNRPHGGDHYLVDYRRPKAQAVTASNQLWVADVTYIKAGASHVFLAAVMDLYHREIVGWNLSGNRKADLVVTALRNAVARTRPPRDVVFHSDQGIEYASYALKDLLHRHGFIQSMSRRGNCYDNAHMESFFHSLKTEWLHHQRFERLAQVRGAVFQYIEGFYNTRRSHSSLGYRSPLNYLEIADEQR
jgi:transposase InsO family protein